MKKLLAAALALALSAVSAGCAMFGSGEVSKTEASAVSKTESVVEKPTAAETTEVPATEAPTAEVPSTAEETTAPPAKVEKTVQLTDLTSIADQPRTTDQLTDNYGNDYGIAILNSTTYYEYLLDGQYAALKGTLYIPKGVTSDSEVMLTVKGDGHVLYASPLMAKTSRAADFEVNILRVNKLSIEWSKYYGRIECGLANAVLVSGQTAGQTPVDLKALPIEITDLTGIAKKAEKTDELTDGFGNTYEYAIFNKYSGDDCFEYLLDKKYSKFKGTLYLPKGETKTDSVTMTLTADGEKIYESPAMSVSSSPVDFEVDLSQCNDFKISFSKSYGWGGTLCVGNAYLYDAQ